MVKKIAGRIVDKSLQQYYTKSNSIVSYMVNQLELKDGETILEPCAGDGVFVDEILCANLDTKITLIELDEKAKNTLEKKYNDNASITRFHNNFFYHEQYLNHKFNKIIANPPYGAWVEHEERKVLTKKFPDISTKETYALFLYNAIKLLEDNGVLTFIIPDTYLYLHRHAKLREFILKNTLVKEIAIFPSSFFPNVNFGYSKLSIITLEKKLICNHPKHTFSVLDNLENAEDLIKQKSEKFYNQSDILKNKNYTFYLTDNEELKDFINGSEKTLGDLAFCVTGIYTGNNKKYFHVSSHNLKNSKSHEIIDTNKINTKHNLLSGIANDQCFLPVARGAGQSQFFKSSEWYIDWSAEAVSHYTNDKKARFQNSKFYFKKGIAVPMVKTKKATAFLLNNQVFEQSIVGVFPKDTKYLYYLLALLNSTTASKIVATINPTANNSANYLKKIPILLPSPEEEKNINNIVEKIIVSKNFTDQDQDQINLIIAKIYEKINI